MKVKALGEQPVAPSDWCSAIFGAYWQWSCRLPIGHAGPHNCAAAVESGVLPMPDLKDPDDVRGWLGS